MSILHFMFYEQLIKSDNHVGRPETHMHVQLELGIQCRSNMPVRNYIFASNVQNN